MRTGPGSHPQQSFLRSSPALQYLFSALEQHDPATADHCRRVSRYASGLARILGWSRVRRRHIKVAGLFHDVGKLNLPADLLRAARPLTLSERQQFNRHPVEGALLLKGLVSEPIIQGVLGHHERIDGRTHGVRFPGYPLGRSGLGIHPYARVLAICDSFDAMTSRRAYRHTSSVAETCRELLADAGGMYDRLHVTAFGQAVMTGAILV